MSAATPPDLPAGSDREGFFGRLVTRTADRANPVLVRYVRQQLRSRGFLLLFTLMLVAAAIFSMVFGGEAAHESIEGAAALRVFGVLVGTWTFAVWVFEPLSAFRAITMERDDSTWDLIRLTGVRPNTLIRGMLQASLVQNILHAAAIAPFLVMAYLLRGIDLMFLVCVLGFIPIAGMAASAGAIFAGCLGVTKATRAVLGVALALCCVVIWIASIGFWTEPDAYRAWKFAWNEAHIVIPLILNLMMAWLVLMTVLSAAMIKPVASNRSTTPRLTVFLLLLNMLAWFVFSEPDRLHKTLPVFCVLGVLGTLGMGMFAVTEDYALSPRQARWIRGARWWQLPDIFGPGGARGRIAFVVLGLIVLAIGATPIISEDRRWIRRGHPLLVAWITWCYGALVLFVGDALARGPLKRRAPSARHRRAAVMLLLVGLTLLATIAGVMTKRGDNMLTLLSPIPGVWAVTESSRYRDAVGVLSVLGGAATLAFAFQGLRLKLRTIRRDPLEGP